MSTERPAQTRLNEWCVATDTIELTRTFRLRLETSDQKLAPVDRAISQWQEIAEETARIMPSFNRYQWKPRNTSLRRTVTDRLDDHGLYAHDRTAAINKVAEAFSSWESRGCPGDYPAGEYGDSQYLRMSTSSSSKKRRQLVAHDDGSFGLQVNILKPHDPIWFGVQVGEYQRERLAEVVDEDSPTRLGVVELRRGDGDELYAHVSVSWPVEVYKPGEVTTRVGVDIGERVLYSVAVIGSDGVETVELESGREFRHVREELTRKRDRRSANDDLRGVLQTRREREKYTEQVTHTASRRIVEIAADHTPCVIHLEDLSDYRQTAHNAIHDWPFAMLQDQITDKAAAAGIPVETVNPAQTSMTCRQCGETNPQFRDGDDFECWECGYQVHADVNAAMNIATREP